MRLPAEYEDGDELPLDGDACSGAPYCVIVIGCYYADDDCDEDYACQQVDACGKKRDRK